MNFFLVPLCFVLLWYNDSKFINTEKLNRKNTQQNLMDSNLLTLRTFHESDIPLDLDGCICYLSTSEKDIKDKKYIAVTGMDEPTSAPLIFVFVNEKQEKLRLISTHDRIKRYVDKSNNYILELTEFARKEVGYEFFTIKGEVKIFKNHKSIKIYFVGKCGC